MRETKPSQLNGFMSHYQQTVEEGKLYQIWQVLWSTVLVHFGSSIFGCCSSWILWCFSVLSILLIDANNFRRVLLSTGLKVAFSRYLQIRAVSPMV